MSKTYCWCLILKIFAQQVAWENIMKGQLRTEPQRMQPSEKYNAIKCNRPETNSETFGKICAIWSISEVLIYFYDHFFTILNILLLEMKSLQNAN